MYVNMYEYVAKDERWEEHISRIYSENRKTKIIKKKHKVIFFAT